MSWLRLHITLGELLLCTTTGISAWWVGAALKRKQDRDIAIRELVRFFCREGLQLVANVSDSVDREFSRGDNGFDAAGRNDIRVALQRLSNSIHAAELAIEKGKLTAHHECLGQLKDANESLRAHILDPMAVDMKLHSASVRSIEGVILKVRESIISLEVEIVSQLQ